MGDNMKKHIKEDLTSLEKAYKKLSEGLHFSQYGSIQYKTIYKYRDRLYDKLEKLRRESAKEE